MSLPFISVIVPAYNAERTIEECIKSLAKQDYPKNRYEIIIIDNKSKDKTAEIIKKYDVKFLEETKIQSSYAARNKGIKHAKGDLIAFTDSDCIAHKDWLKEGSLLFKDVNVGCVGGEIKGHEQLLQENPRNGFGLPFPKTANAFYRKDVIRRIGLFEPWVSGGDADLAWRMQLNTRYKVKFAEKSIVFHEERAAKRLFRQSLKWGISNSILSRKYPNMFPKRALKYNLKVMKALVFGAAKVVRNRKKKERLDFISWFGWELGKLIGKLK